MNKLLTKIVGLSLGLSMAIGVGVAASFSGKDSIEVNAATATFLPSDFTATTSADFSKTTDGITVSANASTVNSTEIRIFKNKTLTVSGNAGTIEAITKIEFTCTASDKNKYGPGCFAALDGYSYSGTDGTWSGSSLSISLTASTNQVRITTLTVTYTAKASTGQKATSVTINGLGSTTKTGETVRSSIALSATVAVDSGTSDNLVTWESSNTSVATIDTNGNLKYVGNGSTTITATSHYEAATTNSNVATASLTLQNLKGLLDNPLTVAETRALIDGTFDSSFNYYTAGKIVSVESALSSNNQATFVISDDGTSTNPLTVFRSKYLENADFTNSDQLSVGDVVIVHGQLDLYNSTYETKYGYIDSLTSSAVTLSVDKASAIIDEGAYTTITATLTNASDYSNVGWSIDSGTTSIISLSAANGQTVTVTGVSEGTDTVVCTYGEHEREIEITVKEVYVPTSETFGKYAGAITTGEYIITYDGAAMNTTVTSNRLQFTSVTPTNDQITTSNSTIKWRVSADGDYWTLYNRNEGLYAASTGAANKAKTESSVTDNSRWTITGTESYEFVNKANTAGGVNAKLRKNNTYGFACYSDSIGGALTLYKKDFTPVGEKTLASLTVEGTLIKTSYTYPEAFDPSGLTIYANYTDPTTYPREDVTSSVTWADLSIGDTSVEGSYTLGEVTKTCEITGITVDPQTQVADDKVLTITSLNLNRTSYAANDGEHIVDGDSFTTKNVMMQSNAIQFKNGSSNENYLTNTNALMGTIKYVTVMQKQGNTGTIAVCAGSETNPSTAATLVKTSGLISVYSIDAAFFTVKSESGVCQVDSVIVELTDATTTALGNARTAAQKILTGLNGLCGESGSGLVTQAQWEAIATSVGTLDADTKAILKGADRVTINDLALGAATIENAMYHYDAVLAKFGYTDILEIGSSAAHTNTSPMVINSETAVVIITVIAAISITSIGALLVLKKRKEQF